MSLRTRSAIVLMGAAGLFVSVAGLPAAQASPSSAATAKGTVITAATTVYGTALVVGSGRFAGFSLYSLTGDNGNHFGCKAVTVKTPIGPLLCTGPSNSHKAEWPAITTVGKPVAGPGVNAALLGTVTRKNVGTQVTYAGHPLYLFDRVAGAVSGESWDEPGLPPWHGVWTLLQPSGKALPWAGTLTTATIKGKAVLAAQMNTGIGTINFPVYSYSKDTPKHSACATGACARAWPLVLTRGTPGLAPGLSAKNLATLRTAKGTQVSYKGRPLYFFAFEQIAPTPTGGFAPTGNGNGVTVGGGTFRLVTP
jgi:predicted lipoprotein with Yx(FWY)xxD motif